MPENDTGLCDECGKNRATVHVTVLTGLTPVQKHLCEECYYDNDSEPTLSASDIFTQLIGALAPELQKTEETQCPECGMNYLEFRQNLIFGCPEDYAVFSAPLEELLESIHGASRHVGRVPLGRAQRRAGGSRVELLKRKMEEAVRQEDFETAVCIRDEITRLERDRC
ncbi:MAG: UvrB/UvrC motif-containing protein [Planctomycetota bacterium]